MFETACGCIRQHVLRCTFVDLPSMLTLSCIWEEAHCLHEQTPSHSHRDKAGLVTNHKELPVDAFVSIADKTAQL